MKFTDPIFHVPKLKPPSCSWWATPTAQQSRDGFQSAHVKETPRIVGDERFGGSKRIHTITPKVKKAKGAK